MNRTFSITNKLYNLARDKVVFIDWAMTFTDGDYLNVSSGDAPFPVGLPLDADFEAEVIAHHGGPGFIAHLERLHGELKLNQLTKLAGVPLTYDYVQLRQDAKDTIDQAASEARMAHGSHGAWLDAEYQLVLDEIKQWKDSGEATVPRGLSDWAAISGKSIKDAVAEIEGTRALWEGLLLDIRKLRLTGKREVDNAGDLSDYSAIVKPYLSELLKIKDLA